MKLLTRLLSLLFFIEVLALTFSSCYTTKESVYFQGIDTSKIISSYKIPDVRIQKGDILSIMIYSDDPEATMIYNQSAMNVSPGSGSGSSSAVGYLVDNLGDIYIQTLGKIHAEGLTKQELNDTLVQRLNPYLKNTYCTIRFMNFRVTMLGEVNKPGTISLGAEKVSILDAIGLAGDLTYYGERNKIMVIREKDGIREVGRIDILSPDAFTSPYFYLQQNDVVYVEPTKKKVAASDQLLARNVMIVSTLVTTIAVLVSLFQ